MVPPNQVLDNPAWNEQAIFEPRRLVEPSAVHLDDAFRPALFLDRPTSEKLIDHADKVDLATERFLNKIELGGPTTGPAADIGTAAKAARNFAHLQTHPEDAGAMRRTAVALQQLADRGRTPNARSVSTLAQGRAGFVAGGLFPMPYTPLDKLEVDGFPAFLVKTSLTEEDEVETRNELAVGLVLNELRALVPNFMYVYGAYRWTRASAPEIAGDTVQIPVDKGGKNAQATYELLETVVGLPFSSWLETHRSAEDDSAVIEIVLQVLLALALARERTGMTHGDLHLSNIIIRPIEKPTVLTYPLATGTRTVRVRRVLAVLIDFGRSTVRFPVPEGTKIPVAVRPRGNGPRGTIALLGMTSARLMNSSHSPNSLGDTVRFLSDLMRKVKMRNALFSSLITLFEPLWGEARGLRTFVRGPVFNRWVIDEASIVPPGIDIDPARLVDLWRLRVPGLPVDGPPVSTPSPISWAVRTGPFQFWVPPPRPKAAPRQRKKEGVVGPTSVRDRLADVAERLAGPKARGVKSSLILALVAEAGALPLPAIVTATMTRRRLISRLQLT